MLRTAGAEENASASAGKGTAAAVKVNAAIPAGALKGMRGCSVMIFLRRSWKIVAVSDSGVSSRYA
jgi:hypothetical protein